MEATEPVLGLKIRRSDVVFLHDTLMACSFGGAQMLQAAALINGLAHALNPAPAAKPEAAKPAPDKPAPDRPKASEPAPTPLRDVPPVPAPAPTVHAGGKKNRKR